MSISRREFFTRMFTGTIKKAEEILPAAVRDMLDSGEKKLLSPEEAAFELVKYRRKQKPAVTSSSNCQPGNAVSDSSKEAGGTLSEK